MKPTLGLVWVSLILLASAVGHAGASITLIDPSYKAGRARFAAAPAADLPKLKTGRFIELPLDYENPDRGSFDSFFRTSENFDLKKPTALFFNGGPGGTSNAIAFTQLADEFNIVYIDQRGTGYSALRTLEDMQNPANFSSELIAKDADAVRKELGLEKVSVYGHSYGTVVATIYAHRFAPHVSAVVLEGVVFNGEPDLWASEYRTKLIQRYYDELSETTKERIRRITTLEGVPKTWFYRLVRESMYEPKFAAEATKELIKILKDDDATAAQKIRGKSTSTLFRYESVFFGAYMYTHIACQELSSGDPKSTWDAEIVDGKFKFSASSERRELCLSLPGLEARMNRTYHAVSYPLTVPVTYFEGTSDVPPSRRTR